MRRCRSRSAPVRGRSVHDVPGSEGLQLHVAERPLDTVGESGAELSAGTRSVSCFLVNRLAPDEAQPDRAYAFQAETEVRTDECFVPRPDLRGAHAGEWDDRVADLHYADTPEYATGHWRVGRVGGRRRRLPVDPHGVDRDG